MSATATGGPTGSIFSKAAVTYTRFEVLRTFRNRRFFIFSLIFPLFLFLAIAGANKNQKLGGISFPLYFMAGMVSWGTMTAVMACGARIALERTAGWTRQIRITPLSSVAYFSAKVAAGYFMAAVSIVLLYIAGISLGVSMPLTSWLLMTGLLLIGLIPFAVLGIVIGHLLTADSIGPALGGITSFFAILGGAYGPIGTGGFFHQVVTLIPSYWLVQAGHTALNGNAWPLKGWIVIAVWAAVLGRLAVWVYQRDTGRV